MRLFIGIAIGLFMILILSFLLADYLGYADAQYVTSRLDALRQNSGSSILVGIVIVALLAGDLVLPVPSSVVMTLSGYFLGWIPGAATAFTGAIASALLGFGLCRRFGSAAFNRLIGEKDTARVAALLDRYGAWAIILSRSVPMLTEAMSCLAGLSVMPFRRFFWLSVAGTLPICVVYAWAGSRSGSASATSGMGWAVAVAFILPALGFAIARMMQRKRPGAEPGTPPAVP